MSWEDIVKLDFNDVEEFALFAQKGMSGEGQGDALSWWEHTFVFVGWGWWFGHFGGWIEGWIECWSKGERGRETVLNGEERFVVRWDLAKQSTEMKSKPVRSNWINSELNMGGNHNWYTSGSLDLGKEGWMGRKGRSLIEVVETGSRLIMEKQGGACGKRRSLEEALGWEFGPCWQDEKPPIHHHEEYIVNGWSRRMLAIPGQQKKELIKRMGTKMSCWLEWTNQRGGHPNEAVMMWDWIRVVGGTVISGVRSTLALKLSSLMVGRTNSSGTGH